MADPAISPDPVTARALRWRGALRRRNYRLFFAGQLVSLAGTWMQQIAQSWLVLTLTNDPFWLGAVAAAQFLPVLVVGLFGGLIADILPKRMTLVWVNAGMAVLAVVLAVLTAAEVVEVWHVLVLAGLLGIFNAIDMPTRQAFTMEMVGRDDLTNAVGLNSAIFNSARIAGPAIGGVVIGIFGTAVCFVVNAVSFAAVIAALLAMRDEELLVPDRPARPDSGREVVDQLAEGLRYVRATPIVLLGVLLVGWVALVALNFNVVVPALAQGVLDVGSEGLGFLLASMGVGSLMSALLFARSRRPRARVIVGGAIGVGLLEIVTGAIRSYPLALVAMFLIGLVSIGMMITANTSIQLATPDRLRGRVMAVYTTVFAGTTPFGALATGWVASRYGTEPTLVVAGILALAAGLVAAVWLIRGGLEGSIRDAREPVVADPLSPGSRPPGFGGN